MQQHPDCTHAVRQNKKVQFITDWAQRVNAPYSLFHIETFVDPDWIRVILSSSLPPRWSPHLELRRCRRGGGRGREPAWLLPRKPRLAYLAPDSGDVTRGDCPLATGDSLMQTGHCCRNEGVLHFLTRRVILLCSLLEEQICWSVEGVVWVVMPFGFNYINKEVRQSSVA